MPVLPDDERFMRIALEEARIGLREGGIPIGSVLVIDGQVRGRGRNRRVQSHNPILHGETDCLQNAGRLKAADYRRATLYTTLSPCDMCAGAILLYKIPRVVMAENRSFTGAEETLTRRGVELVNLGSEEAVRMMQDFIRAQPQLWNEDIGL
ncbi:MAG TPA: nucleoside deaminase [bacterium]|nr:nucleoside deaminase [bacterium]